MVLTPTSLCLYSNEDCLHLRQEIAFHECQAVSSHTPVFVSNEDNCFRLAQKNCKRLTLIAGSIEEKHAWINLIDRALRGSLRKAQSCHVLQDLLEASFPPLVSATDAGVKPRKGATFEVQEGQSATELALDMSVYGALSLKLTRRSRSQVLALSSGNCSIAVPLQVEWRLLRSSGRS